LREISNALKDYKMNGEKRFRELTIDKRAVDEESRTVELAFSSEEPYERSFGVEILDHDQKSADFSRLHSGAPLLVNHDPNDQIGVVESARIDDDRVGRAVVRFGKSQRAQEIFGDVQDGVRRLVSVGYYVKQVEKAERDGDELATYRVSSWQPLEISLVAVPADPTVGVGRSADSEESEPLVETKSEKEPILMNEDSNTLTVEASPRIEVNESEIRKAEQKRSKELVALGAKYNCIDEAQRAIEDGKDAGQFSRWILENNLKTEEPTEVRSDDGEIGLNENEKESYSLVRAIHTFCEKGRFDGLEYEASEAAKKRYGRNSDGLVIPTDVLNHASKRALNVGTATAGGNTVATDLLGASFIDLLRNASVLSQTGATYLNGLQGDVAIPRQSGAATAYWLSEVAAVTDSAQTVDQVTMTPKGLSAQTTFSKQLLAQSSIDIEQFVRNDLATVLAIAQDLAAVNGSGSSGQPTGILGISGVGSVTSGGTSAAYTDMVNLEKEVAVDNALSGSLSYVTNAKLIAKLKRTEIASNTAKFVYEDGNVNGYPMYMSNQLPATYSSNTKSAVIFGNFSDLLIGNWNGIDVVVDPYTAAGNRQVKIVTSLWTDVAVRHPESFAKCIDILH
jgi:HK97 family phage major capsid protein